MVAAGGAAAAVAEGMEPKTQTARVARRAVAGAAAAWDRSAAADLAEMGAGLAASASAAAMVARGGLAGASAVVAGGAVTSLEVAVTSSLHAVNVAK